MNSRQSYYLAACGLLAAAAVAVDRALDERGAAARAARAPAEPLAMPIGSDHPARSQARSHPRGTFVERNAAGPASGDRVANRAPLWQHWHMRQSTPHGTLATAAKAAIHHPAVWVDLGDQSLLSTAQQADLQQAAAALEVRLTESSLPLESPDYRARWQAEIDQSDQWFRQRYGGYAWHLHHVQAFHLGNKPSTR